MRKVLVIGQTPPPYHGQSMMIQRLIQADLKDVHCYHLRMSFSKSSDAIGKFEIGKVFHMFYIIRKAIAMKFRYKIPVLYYLPAGPNFVPVMRDIIMLPVIRLFFKKTIFHFRAAGVSEYLEQSSGVFKSLGKTAYDKPDCAIQLSARNPADGEYFQARKNIVVKNGLEDAAIPYLPIYREKKKEIQILFVGILSESKGVMVLLEAAKILLEKNQQFHITFVGGFSAETIEEKANQYCAANNLTDSITFAGVKSGDEKWQYFINADIFCFPSYYESESFGNVVVEAMMFELPVVSTYWRGIPDIVQENQTGFLVKVKDASALAEKLSILIQDSDLRFRMGKAGRERYLAQYTLAQHLEEMRQAFLLI